VGRGEWDKALNYQVRSILTVGETARRLGRWEEVRCQLLQLLAERERWPELLAIALPEGDAARALDLYSRLPSESGLPYRADLARVAAGDFPAQAAVSYWEMVEEHIRRQQRDSYREATRCLVRIKDLWDRVADNARWQKHITALKDNYPRHRALQEEVRSAGL